MSSTSHFVKRNVFLYCFFLIFAVCNPFYEGMWFYSRKGIDGLSI